MICDLTIGLCLAKRMTINFGCLYDKFLVGNYKILLFCPFLFTVDFKALCHSSHYSLQAIRRCSFSFFLKVKALLPHSLTINHLQMTFGVIFIRFMIIMRDISKAICGIVQNIVPILKKMSRKLYCTTNLNQMVKN